MLTGGGHVPLLTAHDPALGLCAHDSQLDVMKFICKEFWAEVFRKSVDNLRTNHRWGLCCCFGYERASVWKRLPLTSP